MASEMSRPLNLRRRSVGLLSDNSNYDKQESQAAAQAGFSGDGAGFRSPRRRLSLQILGQQRQGFAGLIEWSRDGEVEAVGFISPGSAKPTARVLADARVR
jgi:hypothetical protein